MPTIPELMSLLEPDKQANDLFINPMFDEAIRWVLSADFRERKDEVSAESAWGVNFDNGFVNWGNRGYGNDVRAVRS